MPRMPSDSEGKGPSRPNLAWTIQVGGLTSGELQQALEDQGVGVNALGQELLAWDGLELSQTPYSCHLVVRTVQELGFTQGATLPALLTAADAQGLHACPWEIGPFLRLHFLDQPEGAERSSGSRPSAPPGSLTIVSHAPSQSDAFPRGFYLRCVDGVLWLRGYRADDQHIWDPEDTLVFRRLP